jgi:hypothetical protein
MTAHRRRTIVVTLWTVCALVGADVVMSGAFPTTGPLPLDRLLAAVGFVLTGPLVVLSGIACLCQGE